MALELVALLCTGLFAGAVIYVTLVEHPARLECGSALAMPVVTRQGRQTITCRYNREAVKAAWKLTLDFLAWHLGVVR